MLNRNSTARVMSPLSKAAIIGASRSRETGHSAAYSFSFSTVLFVFIVVMCYARLRVVDRLIAPSFVVIHAAKQNGFSAVQTLAVIFAFRRDWRGRLGNFTGQIKRRCHWQFKLGSVFHGGLGVNQFARPDFRI
jgi:hypothetical protein